MLKKRGEKRKTLLQLQSYHPWMGVMSPPDFAFYLAFMKAPRLKMDEVGDGVTVYESQIKTSFFCFKTSVISKIHQVAKQAARRVLP